MTNKQLNTWERVTDESDYLKGNVLYIQPVGEETGVFRFVEISPMYAGTQLAYHTGVVDVDAVNMKPVIDYYEGIHIEAGEDWYAKMCEYILEYYGGEHFDSQPFYYETSRMDDMAQLEFLLNRKGIPVPVKVCPCGNVLAEDDNGICEVCYEEVNLVQVKPLPSPKAPNKNIMKPKR